MPTQRSPEPPPPPRVTVTVTESIVAPNADVSLDASGDPTMAGGT